MTDEKKPISSYFLTGFTASGKTSVGMLLSRMLNLPFVDLDELIVERSGKPIPVLFRELGEEQYRALEAALLEEITAAGGRVVALGAGTIVFPPSRELIRQRGILIHLDVEPGRLFERIRVSEKRILFQLPQDEFPLRDDVLLRRIEALYEQRRPLYMASDITISATHLNPQEIVQKILFALHQFGKPLVDRS